MRERWGERKRKEREEGGRDKKDGELICERKGGEWRNKMR
jgi:hypothetical protein